MLALLVATPGNASKEKDSDKTAPSDTPAADPIATPLTLPITIPIVSVGTPDHFFNIGTERIRAKEYCAFLNAVASKNDPHHLYNIKMSPVDKKATIDGKLMNNFAVGDSRVANIKRTQTSDNTFLYTIAPGTKNIPSTGAKIATENLPVTYVSLFSAARFCNWMHNGQGGPETTETGAYSLEEGTLEHIIHPIFQTITLQLGARWRIPTQEEWSAFYDQYGAYDATKGCWEWTMTTHELTQNPFPGHSHYGTYIQMGGTSYEPRYNNSRPDQIGATYDTGFRIMPVPQ